MHLRRKSLPSKLLNYITQNDIVITYICLLKKNRTCPERTKCKLRAVRNCQQGNCQLTMKPSCVLSIKAGFCPAPDIIDESTSAQCQDDSDCDGTFKCCPSLTRNSCSSIKLIVL